MVLLGIPLSAVSHRSSLEASRSLSYADRITSTAVGVASVAGSSASKWASRFWATHGHQRLTSWIACMISETASPRPKARITEARAARLRSRVGREQSAKSGKASCHIL